MSPDRPGVVLVLSQMDDDDLTVLRDSFPPTRTLLTVLDRPSPVFPGSRVRLVSVSRGKPRWSCDRPFDSEWHHPQAVIGLDEEWGFEVSRQISRWVQGPPLPRLSRHTGKGHQKHNLVRAGLPTPPCLWLTPGRRPPPLPFPLVLKAGAGTGGEAVHLCLRPQDLHRALKGHPKRGHAYVEPLTSGTEYSCDVLWMQGRVHILRLCEKLPATFGHFGGFLLLAPPLWPEQGPLLNLARQLATRLRLPSGIFMMDLILQPSGSWTVLEYSPRPGLSSFVDLMERLWGAHTPGALIALRTGLPLPPLPGSTSGLVLHLRHEGPRAHPDPCPPSLPFSLPFLGMRLLIQPEQEAETGAVVATAHYGPISPGELHDIRSWCALTRPTPCP